MRYTLSQILFALGTSLGAGLLAIAAPGGHVLVGSPPTEKVIPNGSIRSGSSHVHHWYSTGGGYHGGK